MGLMARIKKIIKHFDYDIEGKADKSVLLQKYTNKVFVFNGCLQYCGVASWENISEITNSK